MATLLATSFAARPVKGLQLTKGPKRTTKQPIRRVFICVYMFVPQNPYRLKTIIDLFILHKRYLIRLLIRVIANLVQ